VYVDVVSVFDVEEHTDSFPSLRTAYIKAHARRGHH
jgi:hypothetical protein